MLKTNILTPVLSGVLAVTVAGSGVLYVLDKKDSSKSSSETDGKENTVLAKVSDKINTTAAKIEEAVKGEADTGYSCTAELSFGKLFSEKAGFEIAPITLKTDAKIKGSKSETDLDLSYNGQSLATVYLINDSETDTAYLKCPELNDAYISLSANDIQKLVEESGLGSRLRTISPNIGSGIGAGITTMAAAQQAMPDLDFSKLQEMLKSIDLEAITKDIEEYIDVAKGAIPEGTPKDNITGEIGGNSYEYEVKSVDVTVKTVADIVRAVADKAKGDTLLKEQLAKLDITEDKYDQLIDSITKSIDSASEEKLTQKLFTADIYSYDGKTVGFSVDVNGQGTIKMIAIDSEEVFALDIAADVSDLKMTVNGAFTNDDDTVNGSMAMHMSNGSDETYDGSITAKDLKSTETGFTGSFKAEFTGGGHTGALAVDSAGSDDKTDLSVNVDLDGDSLVTLKVTGEKTDASDVTVPDGTIYSFDEEGLKAFKESCKVDSFTAHIKDVIGEDAFNKIANGGRSVSDDDDNDVDDDNDIEQGLADFDLDL